MPLSDAAIRSLTLCAAREGPVCANLAIDRTRDIGRTAGFELPENCFRHSFIIIVTIGDWQVHLADHNLRPLYDAIADHSLLAVHARPDLIPNHPDDFFGTNIRLLRMSSLEIPA